MALKSSVVCVVVVSVVLAGIGCSFDHGGLAFYQDGSVSGDAQGAPDVAVFVDGQIPADAGPGVDGQISQDAAVQTDAAPTCVPASCPLGCNLGGDRCNRLAPSNFSAQGFHDTLTAGVTCVAGENVTVNTDNGSMVGNVPYRTGGQQGQTVSGIHWTVVVQPGGGELAVFGLTHLNVPALCEFVVMGSRPAAFYVTGEVVIGGTVSGYGELKIPGPGGGLGGASNGDPGDPCGGDPVPAVRTGALEPASTSLEAVVGGSVEVVAMGPTPPPVSPTEALAAFPWGWM